MLRHRTLPPIEDDTEDAPWMTVSDWQHHAVDIFYNVLVAHLEPRTPRPYVGAMLPIRFRPDPERAEIRQLSPDVLVSSVDLTMRTSYDLDVKGIPPSFVLEVVSPSSEERDLQLKPLYYEAMGVREYAIFGPLEEMEPPLQGYRRDERTDELVRWQPDEEGRLWSEVIGAWLVRLGVELQLQRADSTWVPTPRKDREARRAAEEEIARLRAELEQRG